MALRTRTIVEQRVSAMELVGEGVRVTEVAERLGVSRQAIYDWIARHREDSEAGLNDRSRRPHSSPTRTAEAIERRVIEERKQWGFGSKKILRRLQDQEPEVAWPPRSTIDAIFKRAGLVRGRPVRRRFARVQARHSYEGLGAGEVMTADYKGQFRLRNGRYCYPLLVADPVSRYLLACDAYTGITLEQTWTTLVGVFREHGLPSILHTDNGMPFGTSGQGWYSTISVRLMKYGIQPAYSRPGHPEDNGRHERLNKTCSNAPPSTPRITTVGSRCCSTAFVRCSTTSGRTKPLARIGRRLGITLRRDRSPSDPQSSSTSPTSRPRPSTAGAAYRGKESASTSRTRSPTSASPSNGSTTQLGVSISPPS
jgi:transposase InsO family protein